MALVVKLLLWGVAALVLLFIGWHLFNALRLSALEETHGEPVDFATLELDWRPNQFLMAPPGLTMAEPMADSPVLPATPSQVAEVLARLVQATPRTRILKRSGDGNTLTVVQTTALMRFPDFATLTVIPVEGGSAVLAYSRAIYGIRDFGVNQRRIEGWMRQLVAEVTP